MNTDWEFNSWITGSKFFPTIKHDEKEVKKDYFKPFLANKMGGGDWINTETIEFDIEGNNIDWYEGQVQKWPRKRYHVAHHYSWMQMYEVYKRISLSQLVYDGLFPWELFRLIDTKHDPKLKKILFSTLPTSECIREQIEYIYSSPVHFLLLLNYGHAQQEMLKQGRDLRSNFNEVMTDEHLLEVFPRFIVEKRVPKEIIRKYLETPHLQRYLLLNKMIIRAPYCKTPLILFRGEKEDRLKLSDRESGYRFVTNSVLSTSLDAGTGIAFIPEKRKCCLFIYHIADQVPRLFMNLTELEILLPAGLEMEFANKERIGRHLCFRIKVLRVIEETI